MFATDLIEPIGYVLECGLPVHLQPLTVLLEHGLGQAFFAIEGLVREAVTIGNPALVDGLVLERHDPHHLVVLHLDHQVGPGGIVWADALAARKLPRPGAVAERLAGQRAHRADVDHVAGKLRIHRSPDKGFDLGMLAAVGHAEFHHTGDLLAKTDTARAVDAARHLFHRDERTYVLVEHHALFFLVARAGTTVTHRQILQLALTALVADRAIQRVVDEQELHHRLLRLDGLVGLGAHDHALRHGCGAGGHGLGGLFHIHQAHAAVGGDGQLLVVAEVRNVGAGFFGRMHDHAAFGHFDLLAVDFDFNHANVVRFRSLRRPACGRPRSWPRTRGGNA